jgi:hypothetical protein
MASEPAGSVGVTLPPRVRGQVESLAVELGIHRLGHVVAEFELDRGKLQSTFIKIGRIKNQELEELAQALGTLTREVR